MIYFNKFLSLKYIMSTIYTIRLYKHGVTRYLSTSDEQIMEKCLRKNDDLGPDVSHYECIGKFSMKIIKVHADILKAEDDCRDIKYDYLEYVD